MTLKIIKIKKIKIWMMMMISLLPSATVFSKNYELKISKCSNDEKKLCINNESPAPTLEFIEGEEAVIRVINELSEETSLHWHGILLENEWDGVSYVTTYPIKAKSEWTFRFKIRQHGTYWYHSHTGFQEQKGLYGAFVIYPNQEKMDGKVILLSDFSEEDPDNIFKNLKKDGDYYSFKKKRRANLYEAIKEGAFFDYLDNERTRMGGMDASDIGYDQFLINGKEVQFYEEGFKKLRIINAAASTYFKLRLGGDQYMSVVAADGIDVKPVLTKEILIGMGETYDIEFDAPKNSSIELAADSVDGSGRASAWFYKGENKLSVPPLEKPSLYKMTHDMSEMKSDMPMNHEMMHGHVNAKEASHVLKYSDLIPLQNFNHNIHKSRILNFKIELSGDMRRYNWFINNKLMSEDRNITILKGDLIRFEMVNHTMMHHPMHLHGHFFRLVDPENPDQPSAIKHTVDVPAHQNQIIEFVADAPGEWLFHCHNLYHMKSGMARVVKYADFTKDPVLEKMAITGDHHMHDPFFYRTDFELFSQESVIKSRASNTYVQFDFKFSYNPVNLKKDHEIMARFWQSTYLNLGLGVYDGAPSASFQYLLPFLIDSEVSYDDQVRGLNIELQKEIPLTQLLTAELTLSASKKLGFHHEIKLVYALDAHFKIGIKHLENLWGAGFEYML